MNNARFKTKRGQNTMTAQDIAWITFTPGAIQVQPAPRYGQCRFFQRTKHYGGTMKIIAYTYESDMHCPACTRKATRNMKVDHKHPHGVGFSALDSFGIEYDTVDREGNLLQPVFDTDEHGFTHCGDCHSEISGRQAETSAYQVYWRSGWKRREGIC